jgi:putative membrane protein
MELADRLAALNATLNGLSGLSLLLGWWLIRQGNREGHRRAMLGAFGISAVFLVSYLTRVALSGTHPYPESAPGRSFYLVMLASHVILAATVPFGAVSAIYFAWKGKFEQHKKVVKLTLPVWLYVSVTGVLVYLMLYQLAGV